MLRGKERFEEFSSSSEKYICCDFETKLDPITTTLKLNYCVA